jgi:hypothetical protein
MGKVLHASYSGYFPFCRREIEYVEGIKYQEEIYIQGSLQAIMALYWRVRKWKYNMSGNFGGPLFIIGQGNFVQDFPLTSEESLVCGGSSVGAGVVTLIGGSRDVPLDFTMNLFTGSGLNTAFFLNEGTCSTYFEIVDKKGYLLSYQPGYPDEEDQLRVAGSYAINLFDSTLRTGKLYTSWPDYPGTTGTCSLIIEPSEYWSYDGTYNTSTGQFL